jgi:SAM-dependent methyltransferase
MTLPGFIRTNGDGSRLGSILEERNALLRSAFVPRSCKHRVERRIFMSARVYERLSQVYDCDWGQFSRKYLTLITQLLEDRGIARAEILDLACGTGTLALELAKLGHRVLGVDVSPHMIEKARSKAMALSHVSFQVQDMRRFVSEGKFDLCACTFDSINYLLTAGDVKETFGRIGAALKQSGLFIFDSNTDRLYTNRHKETHSRELGGESFVQKCIYDPSKTEATTVFEFSDGAVEVHKQRPYDLTQLEPLLADAGMRVAATFGDFDKRPYDPETERLFCIAEKQ